VRFFHGQRYDLRAWGVMPNHVHALFKVDATPMAEILESWKKHTANKANRQLHRRGKFWQADYWDTFMRDSAHELETCNYIENNPVKAGLVLDPKTWPWSSSRFRDEFGVLKF
jgi:REP element-mobilizing transposase RayT